MITGIMLGLMAGVTLGCITSFAALSYDHGATPIGLVFFRAVFALIVTLGLAMYNRESLRVNLKGGIFAVLTGISLSLVGFGYMASVAFITPGLAVAILYLFPLMVLATESLSQRSMPPLGTVVAFALALFGIVLCLGLTWSSLDWRGIALGVIAAIGMSGYLISSSRLSAAGLGFAPLVWANVFVILLAVILAMSLPGGLAQLALPENTTGQLAALAAAVFYSLGIILAFLALRWASAPLIALMMNIEPITTLIAAWLIVGENLTMIQYIGMLVAVFGITLGGIRRSSAKKIAD